MKKPLFFLLPLLAGTTQGALVTDLSPGDANWTFAADGNVTGLSGIDNSTGHTVNLQFTPTAADLSGTTVLFEFGGSSNGFGISLIDGRLTYSSKHNSSDAPIPDSLNDLALRPDGSSEGQIAVQSGFNGITVGATYSAAVSWNQGTQILQFGIQDDLGLLGMNESFTITGVAGNWSGNDSASFGTITNSAGGFASELAENGDVGAPWDVNDTPVNDFAGTAGDDILFWNAAGNVTTVPEPTTSLLALLGFFGLARRRR